MHPGYVGFRQTWRDVSLWPVRDAWVPQIDSSSLQCAKPLSHPLLTVHQVLPLGVPKRQAEKCMCGALSWPLFTPFTTPLERWGLWSKHHVYGQWVQHLQFCSLRTKWLFMSGATLLIDFLAFWRGGAKQPRQLKICPGCKTNVPKQHYLLSLQGRFGRQWVSNPLFFTTSETCGMRKARVLASTLDSESMEEGLQKGKNIFAMVKKLELKQTFHS